MVWLNHPWVAWAAGIFVMLGGGWLTLWSLFHDRSRGRRRCPRCWYDMRGTPGMRCSECGHEARSEAEFSRTRRRWRRAGLGVVIITMGVGCGLSPKVRRDGCMSIVPTTALLLLADPAHTIHAPSADLAWLRPTLVNDELRRRLWAGSELWSWQWRYVIQHKQLIRTRRKWPADIPLIVQASMPHWAYTRKIVAVGRLTEAQKISAEGGGFEVHATKCPDAYEPTQVAGISAPGSREVVFDCSIYRPSRSVDVEPARVWEGALCVTLEVVGTTDEAVLPVRGPAVNEAMRTALAVHPKLYRPRDRQEPRSYVEITFGRGKRVILKDIAIGFAVELLCDGAVAEVARVRRYAVCNQQDGIAMRPEGDAWFVRVFFDAPVSADSLDQWSVRIRGDAEMALTDFDYGSYWAGELTVPFTSAALEP